MKRKTVTKWVNAGLVLCLCMSILAGCKNKAVDYDMDGVTEGSTRRENEGSETGLKQFADESRWSEEWTAEGSDGEKYQCEVDVNISVPDAEQMYVIEVEEASLDETERERIADKLFGAGKNKDGENEYSGKYEGISYELGFGVDATEAFGAYLKYVGNLFRYPDTRDFERSRMKNVFFVPKDIYQVCPSEVRDVAGLYYKAGDMGDDGLHFKAGNMGASLENQCGLSEEEAQSLAQSFVENLEMEYPVYAGFRPLHWFKGTSFSNQDLNYMADGYVFFYDAGIDNLSFVEYGTMGTYALYNDDISKSMEERYSLRSRMEIYVNENGIIGMRAYNPINIRYVSKEVKLLPLKTVKGIIKEYSNQNKLLTSKEYPVVDELELIYFRVRDKKNSGYYSYIPTWRLSDVGGRDDKLNASLIFTDTLIFINAMDGSVIDLYEEI